MGIVRPVMERYAYAWAFFVPFILIATFTMLNLFIAVVVNAMQSRYHEEEAAEAEAAHRERETMLNEVRAAPIEEAGRRHLIAAGWIRPRPGPTLGGTSPRPRPCRQNGSSLHTPDFTVPAGRAPSAEPDPCARQVVTASAVSCQGGSAWAKR